MRNRHSVIHAGAANRGGWIGRIESTEADQPDQLIALRELVAIEIIARDVDIGIANRVDPVNETADLIGVAVVAGAQKRLLVRA